VTASADGTPQHAAPVSAVESAVLNAGHQRARSLRTVEAFYRALQAKDIDRFAGLWTKDAVYRVPVTAEGVPGQIEGRDAIVSGIGDFFELFGETRFTWKAEPMLDSRRVMATWTLDIELVAGGTYRNRGVAIFQMDGDRIADFSEYFDTAAFLKTSAPIDVGAVARCAPGPRRAGGGRVHLRKLQV
jgi:ketosteroid isomerase-like protein